jgi:DNA processing protein
MHHFDERLLRLGCLLAGGGSALRRAVAGCMVGGRLDTESIGSRLPHAVRDTALRLAASEAPTVIDEIAADDWRWVIPGDDDYPELLDSTSDPPLGLFVRGRLTKTSTVAVVGSRRATPYGLQVARLLGEELGRTGVAVVSGMARGVDAAAHRGALNEGGPTWAVWGTGPDRLYPPEHGQLAAEIAASGALLTEYPPGTPPKRHHFPERNRILAGMAQAVVVVEAAARSGALITARLAAEEGRDVMAVPGNIFSELSVGPNTLLRVGARPLLTPRDVFEALGVPPAATIGPPSSSEEADEMPCGEAVTVDEFAARAGLDAAAAAAELVRLELTGEVERLPDGRYARSRGCLPSERPPGSRS